MTQRPMFSQRERRAVTRAIRIVAGVAILIAAAALALALASAHPTDDGFYAVGFAETRNWMGDAGAMIADLLFMTIGAGAYAAVALAAAWGLKILANRAPTHPTRRLLIAPIALVALAGFASALWGETETQAGLGGVIGDFVAGVLRDSLPFADAGSRGLAAGALLGA
ncbi:MAG: DNA translocase FtsK 4TM domain-containing protein, partial [Pseudomonadota bacterium]